MTKALTLTNGWQAVTTGPCYIELSTGLAFLYVAEEDSDVPNAQTDAFHRLDHNKQDFAYGGTKTLFARASATHEAESRIIFTGGS